MGTVNRHNSGFVISDSETSSRTSRKKGWADLDLSLYINDKTKDLYIPQDEQAIRNAVKNLLLSNFYDRPFAPTLGANMRGLLFEPADTITKIALKENIENVLRIHEGRIELYNVFIDDLADDNAYRITAHYNIKEYDIEQEVELVLRRLR